MKEQIEAILKSKDLKDISIEMVESALDSQLPDEFLKEIPVLKSFVAFKNLFISISDKIFIKKAMRVLIELGEVNWRERVELANELSDKNGNGAEKILMAIDKIETFEKCQVYGRLCRLKALNKITLDGFLRLTKVIQDAYLDDLYLIRDFKKGQGKVGWGGDYAPIFSLGLIFQESSEQEEIRINHHMRDENDQEVLGGKIEFNYYLSDTGTTLLEHYDELFPKGV